MVLDFNSGQIWDIKEKGSPAPDRPREVLGWQLCSRQKQPVQRGQQSRRKKGEERKPRRMVSYKTVRAPVSGARLVPRSVVESA